MKLHRFYVGNKVLEHTFWIDDEALFHQWIRVLRFDLNRELVLFNDTTETRLYRITKIGTNAVQLTLVTELEPQVPDKNMYLCFSILKKDKTDWVLQKATELGVRHFTPLLADRTEKTGWNKERAEKIVIEAAEQCGRSDVPRLRDPITPEKLIVELNGSVPVVVAEQGDHQTYSNLDNVAILIGPEGGWSDAEKELFESKNLPHYSISPFTLRAETACVAAATLLLSPDD